MKFLLLLLLCSAFAQQPIRYTPTRDFIDCRIEKTRFCFDEDIGALTGTWLDNNGRISDFSHKDIYHDVFTYKDGVMYIERPIRVIESWRTATDSTIEKLAKGQIRTCRHSACIEE